MRTKKTFYNRPHCRVESKSFGPNPYVSYIFWDTEVVRFENKTRKLTLNTGGWDTATTMERINLALDDLACPLHVGREKFRPVVWNYKDQEFKSLPFDDHITFIARPGVDPEDWIIEGVNVELEDVR